jgi:3-hydroxyisobutyrate dehydrogenase-like beta-hydroxyacid dehydrogenase
MRVGFVGLGTMGGRMVGRLVGAGYRPVVYDLVPSAVASAVEAGATAAGDLGGLVRGVEVVLSSLPMPEDVERVYQQVAEAGRPEQVCLDLSTIDPATARRVGETLAAKGLRFLDGPVSGGPRGAAAGTLAVMVGGDAEALELVRPLLAAFSARVFHVGPVGAGSVVKLANQLLVGAGTIAAMEAVGFARRAGVGPETLLDVVSASTGDSVMLRRSIAEFVLTGDFSPQFALRLLAKDLRLYAAEAEALGAPSPSGQPTRDLYERALARGLGGEDFAAIVKVIEELT